MRKADVIDEGLIAEANNVLGVLHPGLRLDVFAEHVNRRDPDDPRTVERINLVAPYATTTIRLCKAGDTLAGPLGPITYGATTHKAIAQLYRFTQGLTRVPMAWWRYRVGHEDVAAAVLESSYLLDPSTFACVLCGKNTPTLDWWSGREGQGPCCTFGACRAAGR